MKSLTVIFEAPRTIVLREASVPKPGAGEVMVKTLASAISAGTEMLVYRGLFPNDTPTDITLPALAGDFGYPLTYGYAAVGEIETLGTGVPDDWLGKHVFAFQPHASRFVSKTEALVLLPPDIDPFDAVFFPNMETAVNLIMDSRPVVGESVLVFGQGVVGLLTTTLLARFPLSALITFDPCEARRRLSSELAGVDAALDPRQGNAPQRVRQILDSRTGAGEADLIVEVSGNPAALDQAIALAGFDARILIGSWYGAKRADLDLGGVFHRRRIRLISSQVSTIAPEFCGRWNKQRRFTVVTDLIRATDPKRFITHRFPAHEASQAYRLLDRHPEKALQVVLTYD